MIDQIDGANIVSPRVQPSADSITAQVSGGDRKRPSRLSRVEAALSNLRSGQMVIIVTEDADREVGHLAMCAGHATPDAVNFMAAQGRGIVSLVISQADVDRLQLPMQQRRSGPVGRAAPVSIEASSGVSTGISTADRARTIQVAADPASTPEDLVSPGHVFPLLAKDDGVFALPGPAEMAADLSRLAGTAGTSVICAILDDRGDHAGSDRLQAMSTSFQLPIVSAADLLEYRSRCDRQLELAREKRVSMVAGGELRAVVYRSAMSGSEVLALMGQSGSALPSPVFVQQGLFLADQIGAGRNMAGFHEALRELERRGHGTIIILGNRSASSLSMALNDVYERQAIPFAGWTLAGRVLVELGLGCVELLDASPEGASILRQLGLSTR